MKTVTAKVTLAIMGVPKTVEISVPNKKTNPDVLLPFLRGLTQMAEDMAVEEVVAKGGNISCAKGCGACCNQLVPITQLEARYLVSLIERMPKLKKQKYKARFLDTCQQLDQAGIMDQLMDHESIGDNYVEFGLNYFHLGIPCPFLEDGSCSIHPERPLRCREYLVTSPASNCSNPSKENIQRVNYPVRMSRFLVEILKPWTKYPQTWVPLSIIFRWVERHPEVSTMRHSTEWIDDALKALSKQKSADKDMI
ncbi:YkgJ family cysteine cluster protein [Kaarinaea lacus]